MILVYFVFKKDGQHLPQGKLGPKAVDEVNLAAFAGLPQHKVAQADLTRRAYEHIQWWTCPGEHALIQSFCRDIPNAS